MSSTDWKNRTENFQKMDVRHVQGNFFPGIQKRAAALEVGEGLEIIQTFEPHPLYEALGALGFEHFTEQVGGAEIAFSGMKKAGDFAPRRINTFF